MNSSSPVKPSSIRRVLFFLASCLAIVAFFPEPVFLQRPELLSAALWVLAAFSAMAIRFLHALLVQTSGLALLLLLASTETKYRQLDYLMLSVSQSVILFSVILLSFVKYDRDELRQRLARKADLLTRLEGEKLGQVTKMLSGNRPAYFDDLTVLFSDIRNFSSLAEVLPADRLYEVLNAYYGGIVRIVREHNGVIDKFLGDGIMVVFGLNQSSDKAPEMAARCALRMLEYQQNEFHADLPGGFTLGAGLGIATGRVMVGLVGGQERFEWTCLGDPVNLAARLERMTRDIPANVLISETTWLAIRDIPDIFSRTVGFTKVRGRFTEEAVIEVCHPADRELLQQMQQSRADLEKALKLRKHGYAEEAQRLFQMIYRDSPRDKVARFYATENPTL